MQNPFRAIPSMDKCLNALLEADASLAEESRSLLASLACAFWEEKREGIRRGIDEDLRLESQLPALLSYIRNGLRPRLRPVLNGAGVIIHTNLGRAVLAEEAAAAVQMAARSCCNLEMDLESGRRGSRHDLVRDLLRRLTGAEDAIVVNNNAAAVLLILDTLCSGGETIVSRGELVEIGGSFRIPDIMRKSGSILKEVGTTNRTRLEDYRAALNESSRAIMRVHASNFRIIGFHESVGLKELKSLAREHGLPLIYDLGSGSLLDFTKYGLPPEPGPREALEQGADCICFSGDKTLGGPQAGIICGNADIIELLKKNPLARALRCDKLCLAALEATLRLYLNPERALKAVPVAAMLSASHEKLAGDAKRLAAALRRAFSTAHIPCPVKLVKECSRAGGGAYPETGLPTTLVCLYPENISVETLRKRLLQGDPPLIGRAESGAFCLDPRTLSRNERAKAVRVLTAALKD